MMHRETQMASSRSSTRQMVWLVGWLAVFCGVVSAEVVPVNPDLSRAARLAYKGEFEDSKLVGKLQGLTVSGSPDEKIWANYLLTLAPLRLLRHGIEPYEDVILNHDAEARKVLGAMAVVRTRRSRGDKLFNEAKFAAAIQQYEPVRVSDDARLSEYAYMKIGWAHLNSQAPRKALDLWMSAPPEFQSENVWLGIGTALIEEPTRSNADVSAVCKRLGADADREGFIPGLMESFDELAGAKMGVFAAQWKRTDCFESLRRKLFEQVKASGDRACDMMSWLQLDSGRIRGASAPVFLAMVERCVDYRTRPLEGDELEKAPKSTKTAALRKTKKAVAPVVKAHTPFDFGAMHQLVSRFELKGAQRKPRLALYRAEKRFDLACIEANTWIQESKPDDQLLVEPQKWIEDCQAAAGDKLSAWWPSFQAGLEQAASQGKLAKEKDLFVFFLAKLTKNEAFREQLTRHLEDNAGKYASTLLPILVAESWEGEKAGKERRTALMAKFGSRKGDKESLKLWDAIRQEQIASLLDTKDFDKVLASLRVVAPEPATSGPYLSVWMAWLIGVQKAGKAKDFAGEWKALMVPVVLKAKPLVAESLLELTCDFQDWKRAENAVAKVDASTIRTWNLSDRFKGCFVAGLKTQAVDEKAWSKVGREDLNFLIDVTQRLRAPKPDWTEATVSGKSLFAADVKVLKAVQTETIRHFKASKRSKDLLGALNRDVTYWKKTQSKIQKHVWSSPEFASAGQELIKDVCLEVREKLPAARNAAKKQVDASTVEELFAPIEKNFVSCDMVEGKNK